MEKEDAVLKALKNLADVMRGLEGKRMMSEGKEEAMDPESSDMKEIMEDSSVEDEDISLGDGKIGFQEHGMLSKGVKAAPGIDEHEMKEFMSGAKKPALRKSMTVVMASPSAKMGKKKK